MGCTLKRVLITFSWGCSVIAERDADHAEYFLASVSFFFVLFLRNAWSFDLIKIIAYLLLFFQRIYNSFLQIIIAIVVVNTHWWRGLKSMIWFYWLGWFLETIFGVSIISKIFLFLDVKSTSWGSLMAHLPAETCSCCRFCLTPCLCFQLLIRFAFHSYLIYKHTKQQTLHKWPFTEVLRGPRTHTGTERRTLKEWSQVPVDGQPHTPWG